MGLDHSSQVQRAPMKSHRGDFYDTPIVAVEALLAVEDLPQRIWEPAAGIGNIAVTLRASGREVFASDLNDRGCPDCMSGIDFLLPGSAIECDAIVTNPPYVLAQKFVEMALVRAPLVIMLMRLAFMESERRTSILENGMLARVHVFARRLPMMHRAGWEGRKANSGMAFAWFVWDRDHVGPAYIDRIRYQVPDPELALPVMMGPEERRRAEIKALGLPPNDGPLFGGS